jgi:RNA polymerase sigma-70 factor (ECF subfamily)
MLWIAGATAHLAVSRATGPAGRAPLARMEEWVAARLDTLAGPGNPGRRTGAVSEPTAEIIDRARAGDAEAFATLFHVHGDDVLRVCRRMLGDAEAASDARSEVFLKARRGLDGYDAARSFRGWLLAIASHHCIDQLRRTATERRVFDRTEPDAGEHRAPGPSPLTRVLARERRDALDRAIESLPVEYRLPLCLRYYAEASYDEIAEQLGTTRARVGTLIFRAKRALRERMSASDAPGSEP